jgi:hypothetical protein
MGSFLVKLLTNPENFKFYSGNSEGQVGNVSSANSFGQKSIPFGKDRPGGGSSSQPYIKGVGLTGTGTKTVGDAWGNFINAWSQPGLLPFNAAFFKPTNGLGPAGLVQNTFNQFASFGPLAGSLVYAVDDLPNIPDSIIRGGTKSLSRSVIDATRLTKYFLDYKSVNGVLFLAKQNLLSRVAVKTEPARAGAAYLYGVLNGGLYTPLSTIGQAATGFAGIHLNDKGIDPTGIIPQLSIRDYQKVAFNRNKNDISSENSKGYQSKVSRKINKIQKLKDYLTDAQVHLQIYKDYDASTDPQYQTGNVPYNGSIYQSYEAAILQWGRDTGYDKTTYTFDETLGKTIESDNNGYQQKLKEAKNKDSQEKIAREKAIKNDKDQEAYYAKQVKKLPEQILDAEEELEELTLGGKYKNRLLRLWDKFGLNINNSVESTADTLLSYGGGPGSILGIGKTKIKFATLNDGITPARTGYNFQDPYEGTAYPNHGPNNPNRFSPDFIYGNGPNGSGGSVFYKAGYAAEDYFGDPDYISKLSNSSRLLENNSLTLQPWATQVTYATDPTPTVTVTLANGTVPLNPKKYSTTDPLIIKLQTKNDVDHSTLEDFRKSLNALEGHTFLSISPSYKTQNIETRLNLGGKKGTGPGSPGNLNFPTLGKIDNITQTRMGPVDRITALPIYQSSKPIQDKTLVDDMIKFHISIYNPDTKENFYMHFRSFIDSFGDSYSADWNKIEYMGRGEKFYKYGGFNRDISLSFTVVAQSKEELVTMYRKLNYLASSLSPYYSTNGYMGGNIANLTLGDYLDNQPGIINSLQFEIPEDSPWNIVIQDPTYPAPDIAPLELPFIIKVQMKFTPIQNFRPKIQNIVTPSGETDAETLRSILNGEQDGKSAFGNQRYISNNNTFDPSGSFLYKSLKPPPIDLTDQLPSDQNQIIRTYTEGNQVDAFFFGASNNVVQENPFGI